jgi:hypothetical protein
MTTQEAIDHYGSIRRLAEALKIWPHAIYRWGDHPPEARQYQLQVLTGGKLKAEG